MTPRVLLLAPATSRWAGELVVWASTGVVGAEVVRCVGVDDLRSRLQIDPAVDLALLDPRTPGCDRDVLGLLAEHAVPVVEVGPGPARLDAEHHVLEPDSPDEVRELLERAGPPTDRPRSQVRADHADPAVDHPGRLVAVIGAGGSGTSTVAAALAQGLASGESPVVLADLALHPDQGMRHDIDHVVPGVAELVDACRLAGGRADVDGLTHPTPGGYRLLLGLRRPSDWVVIRPRAFAAAIDALRGASTHVVADLDHELEGRDETGSNDVEDRHLMARTTARHADLVLVTMAPDLHGLHRGAALVDRLLRVGVEERRLQPVLVGDSGSRRRRADLAAALAELVGLRRDEAPAVAAPLTVSRDRRVERAVLRGRPLPDALGQDLARTVRARLEALPQRVLDTGPGAEQVPPGHLGMAS